MVQFLIALTLTTAVIVTTTSAQLTSSSSTWSKLLNVDKNLLPSSLRAATVPLALDASSGDLVQSLEELLKDPQTLNEFYGNYEKVYQGQTSMKIEPSGVSTFRQNLVKILTHNLKAAKGQSSYEMGVNQFSHMSASDIDGAYKGCLKEFLNSASLRKNLSGVESLRKPNLASRLGSNVQARDSIDWRQYGVVSPVKNQQSCGSCVFFSAVGTLEASHAIWHNKEIKDLSEQELVDCARGNGNNGCGGGTFVPTFNYLQSKGVASESDYPYEAKDGQCRANGRSRAAKINQWAKGNREGDENGLKESVSTYGPVAIAIHVSDELARYSNGIFEGPCNGGRNHAVVAVGYANEGGKDYWIVRNSWGQGWGDQGYIRIRRNAGNMCDVAGDTVIMNA